MLEETKRILSDLIAFPTVSADSNLDMIAYLEAHLSACGAEVRVFPDDSGKKANLFATIGPDVQGGLVLSGHCDVVPVADQDWATDPFEMVERDGRLYGRGSCDMKGFVAATLALAPHFAAKDRERPVHFAFTHDEETGCLGAIELARTLKAAGIRPAMAIVGEPTMMQIVDGHKGCYEYTTRFVGLEGHGSDPGSGVNAVEYATRFASRLLELRDELTGRAPENSRFSPPWTTLNIGAIHGGTTHNVIAAKAQVDWEFRPVSSADANFVKSEMASFCADILLPAMRDTHPPARIETEVIGEVVGLSPQRNNAAKELLMRLTGANTASLVPFGTEAGLFQELCMDVVVCGPGSIEQAHKADEFVSIDQLQRCLDVLGKL